MDKETLDELAQQNICLINEQDGSSQVKAEKDFIAAAEQLMTPQSVKKWREYCSTATAEEVIISGIEIVEGRRAGY